MDKSHPKSNNSVIITIIICLTVLIVAGMVFVYALAALNRQPPTAIATPSAVESQPTSTTAGATTVPASDAPTTARIKLPPDALSSKYQEAFKARYPEDVLRDHHKKNSPDIDYSMHASVVEKVYSKFYQDGYKTGWMEFYAGTAHLPSSDDIDVLTTETRDVASSDGYRDAIYYLTKNPT